MSTCAEGRIPEYINVYSVHRRYTMIHVDGETFILATAF